MQYACRWSQTKALANRQRFPNLLTYAKTIYIDIQYILQFIACKVFFVYFISQKMLEICLGMVN